MTLALVLFSLVACRSSADGVGETRDTGDAAESGGGSGETGDVGNSGESGAGETGSDPGETGDTADTDGLVGDPLDPPLAPPIFAVLDQAGEERTEAWLVGHPTVLWFFREAEGST